MSDIDKLQAAIFLLYLISTYGVANSYLPYDIYKCLQDFLKEIEN